MTVRAGTMVNGEVFIELSSPIDQNDVEETHNLGITFFRIILPDVDDKLDFLPMFANQILKLNLQLTFRTESLKPLESLHGLRYLLSDGVRKFDADLTRLPNLISVRLDWSRGADSVFDCPALEDLYIYNFPDEDLSRVARLRKLRELRLGPSRRLKSLAGLEQLAELSFLGIYYSPFLTDVSSLTKAKVLERLDIEKCRRACDLKAIAAVTSLKWLTLVGCNDIPSLAPLEGHPSLERLFLSETMIADGDMRPLLRMPRLADVTFRQFRHYSHSKEEIRELLLTSREQDDNERT